jgi:hypothetical protein
MLPSFFLPWEGLHLREETEILIAAVVQGLRAGKSPKEIAFILQLTPSAIKMMMVRHPPLREIFVDTYPLRYTNRTPPQKIVKPLEKSIRVAEL